MILATLLIVAYAPIALYLAHRATAARTNARRV